MNRREFLKHPAIPAVAVGAACVAGGVAGAMSPAEDEKYIRVPAVGTRVRSKMVMQSGDIGKVTEVVANGLIYVRVLRDHPTNFEPYMGWLHCIDSVEVIDPNPEWVLVPRPR